MTIILTLKMKSENMKHITIILRSKANVYVLTFSRLSVKTLALIKEKILYKGISYFPTTCQNGKAEYSEIDRHYVMKLSFHFTSIQSLSHVRLFANPWTAACQASLSITNSESLLKLITIKSVMPSNHLIPCHPLSSWLQSFPASGFFPMSQFFASCGQVLELQLQHQSFQ